MTYTRRSFGRWLGAAALSGGRIAHAHAHAHEWVDHPERPVRLIVVYPPGGVSDSTARALAEGLKERTDVTVIVQNRPGARGWIGLDALARAAPDGHTLAFSAITPLTLNPFAGTHLTDLYRRVLPVAGVMRTPVLIVGTSALKGQTFEDLIAQARERPGAVRWATSGVATTGHLVMAQVAQLSQTTMVHVPYRGGGQPINEALGGQFEALSTNMGALQLQHVLGGHLKALAVGAPMRLAALPAVPTLAELGYGSANLDSLFGIFAPAQMPSQRIERWNLAINQVLATEDFRGRLHSTFDLEAGASVAAFEREIEADRAKHKALMRRHPALLA